METKSINWAHHRNGVAGWPFECAISGTRLRVRFLGSEDEDGFPGDPAAETSVDVQGLEIVADAVNPGGWESVDWRGTQVQRRFVTGWSGETGVVVFDELSEDGARRFVALTTGDPDDYMTAVFDLGMLVEGNVTFGENSWRGDHYHNDVRRWLG